MQIHDFVTLLAGMILGALAAHFHPGTIAKKKRTRAIPRGTAEQDAAKRPGRPRKAPKTPEPAPGPSLPME